MRRVLQFTFLLACMWVCTPSHSILPDRILVLMYENDLFSHIYDAEISWRLFSDADYKHKRRYIASLRRLYRALYSTCVGKIGISHDVFERNFGKNDGRILGDIISAGRKTPEKDLQSDLFGHNAVVKLLESMVNDLNSLVTA